MDLDVPNHCSEARPVGGGAVIRVTNVERTASSGIKLFGTATAAANALRLVQYGLIANILSPEDLGLFGMVLPIIGLANLIADGGTANAIIHRDEIRICELRGLSWFNACSAALLLGVLWLAAPLCARVYSDERIVELLRMYAWILPVAALGVVPQAVMEKQLRFRALAALDVASALVGVVVAVWTAIEGFGAASLVCSAIAAALVRAVSVICLAKLPATQRVKVRLRELLPFVSFGAPHIGQRLVNQVYSNIDVMLIGAIIGAPEAGIYAVAQQCIVLVAGKVNMVFGRVFFPLLARSKHDRSRVKSAYLRLQRYTAFVNLPLLAGLAAVAPVAFPLFLGDSWRGSIPIVQLLAVVAITRAIAGTVGPLLLVVGQTKRGFSWSILALALQSVGMWVGVGTGSLIGAASASVTVSLILLPLNYLLIVRPIVGACASAYFRTLAAPLWQSVAMAVVVCAVAGFVHSGGVSRSPQAVLALLLEVIAGVIAYLLLAWGTNRSQMREAIAMLFRKESADAS